MGVGLIWTPSVTTCAREAIWIVVLCVATKTHPSIVASAVPFIVHGNAITAVGIGCTGLKSFDITVRLVVPIATGFWDPI